MTNTIQFKVHGVSRLLTYDQLVALERQKHIGVVRVIDTRTQRNWNTNFKTVVVKFR
jgi:hypothetical protein